MRIALVTESFRPLYDDRTVTVRRVADRLVDLGHDVLVVAPAPGLGSYRGARVTRIRATERVGRHTPGRQVRDALTGFGPDLVHVATPGLLGCLALGHARRTGVPSLVVQETRVPRSGADRWRRTVPARADRLVVTCRWLRATLAADGVGPVPVWEPGVDAVAFSPVLSSERLRERWTRDDRVPVGHVGELRKRHGVRGLAALATLARVRPVLVGDGPQRAWLERRLPGVHVTGGPGAGSGTGPATGDLAAVLASLDVLVQPDRNETCGHTLRAAAASGVPVVAPAAGGVPDAVRHQHTGLLYDPDDPRGLVRAVGALVADPAARAALGARARRRALRRSWSDAVDELVDRHYAPLLGLETPAA